MPFCNKNIKNIWEKKQIKEREKYQMRDCDREGETVDGKACSRDSMKLCDLSIKPLFFFPCQILFLRARVFGSDFRFPA